MPLKLVFCNWFRAHRKEPLHFLKISFLLQYSDQTLKIAGDIEVTRTLL